MLLRVSIICMTILLFGCNDLDPQNNSQVDENQKQAIVEVVNKLFIYTDAQNWDGLQSEVFADSVRMDMTSVGAPQAQMMAAEAICAMWEQGFEGLDAIHHQAGNYVVTIKGTEASVFAYAIASHYKAAAKNGSVREFIGSYDLALRKSARGWRLNKFTYNLKYMDGNLTLE
jgi:ketosteroid isomerase-like protein